MGSLIWGLCAFLFTFLIVYFLPLGLTKKGKIIVILAGMLLAFAGNLAASSFSLLLTVLLLLALAFFLSCILDSRLGKQLYVQVEIVEKQKMKDHIFESSLIETAGSSEKSENDITPIPINKLAGKENERSQIENKLENDTNLSVIETDNDDISFLFNRSIAVEEETKKKEEKPKHEVDYLAEIEDLLGNGSDEIPRNNMPNNPYSNVIEEIPRKKTENITIKKKESSDGKQKETDAAAGLEEIPVLPHHQKEDEN